MSGPEATERAVLTVTRRRVDYSETDQMGVVYHARYLVWLDVARTEHLRHVGTSYLELEARGFRLAVSEVNIRYRQPARYDDPVRVRTWVREIASRRVIFGYVVEHDISGEILATATTALVVLDAAFSMSRLPADLAAALRVSTDPVKV